MHSQALRKPKRPDLRRVPVNASVTRDTLKTLEMLGFNIPALINDVLTRIADKRRCPCCNRDLKPVITGRTESNE